MGVVKGTWIKVRKVESFGSKTIGHIKDFSRKAGSPAQYITLTDGTETYAVPNSKYNRYIRGRVEESTKESLNSGPKDTPETAAAGPPPIACADVYHRTDTTA